MDFLVVIVGIKHGFHALTFTSSQGSCWKQGQRQRFSTAPRDLANFNALKNHAWSLLLHKFNHNENNWVLFFSLIAIILLIHTCTTCFYKNSHFRPWLAIMIFVYTLAAVHKSKSLSVDFSLSIICPSLFFYKIWICITLVQYTYFMDTCSCKLTLELSC